MATITSSVGRGGTNRRNDVIAIQKLINTNTSSIAPLKRLAEDGLVGSATISAIEAFQRHVVKLSRPDGRVDPGGRTLQALNKNSTTTTTAKVTYSNNLPATKQIVSEYTKNVIKLALKKVGMPHAVITSTIRTPEEQAHIMYRNARKNLAGQFRLYGATGDEVLKVYKANSTQPEATIIKLMREKIEALLKLGRRTSKHVVTVNQYKSLNIVDIGVNSTRAVCGSSFNIDKFTRALVELKNAGYIDKVIDETQKSNTCWHIEVSPNKKALPAN